MKQTYFFRIAPEGLAGNCKCNHLLLAELDTETDKFALPDGKLTCCGHFERDKAVKLNVEEQWVAPEEWLDDYELYSQSEYMDYMRLFLAEEQNNGVEYCADCVARFYSPENSAENCAEGCPESAAE
ncbi:MAG: hypothetical protein LBV80_11655 [Deltaproteobacteria bacterium]|jgi:hypothetical protein|nr:hypothetical protein [Deltaproteobacteria bacterium]